MTIGSFDIEDENGVHVTGTVEVFHKRDGVEWHCPCVIFQYCVDLGPRA